MRCAARPTASVALASGVLRGGRPDGQVELASGQIAKKKTAVARRDHTLRVSGRRNHESGGSGRQRGDRRQRDDGIPNGCARARINDATEDESRAGQRRGWRPRHSWAWRHSLRGRARRLATRGHCARAREENDREDVEPPNPVNPTNPAHGKTSSEVCPCFLPHIRHQDSDNGRCAGERGDHAHWPSESDLERVADACRFLAGLTRTLARHRPGGLLGFGLDESTRVYNSLSGKPRYWKICALLYWGSARRRPDAVRLTEARVAPQ